MVEMTRGVAAEVAQEHLWRF